MSCVKDLVTSEAKFVVTSH